MLSQIPSISQYFNITDKLGEGTFSKVYKAKLKHPYWKNADSEEYALKYIIPIVKPIRVAKELRYLRDLGGLANVIPMKACFYNSGHTVIVMPIIEHDKFLDYLQQMDIDEVRDYIRNLLISLERVHAHGIIHRDIKPSNFLYNRATRRYALVDFGLSQSERELYHAINYATHQVNKSNRANNESKARKNLNLNFVKNCLINCGDKAKAKRSHDEIENQTCENNVDATQIAKRAKYEHEPYSSIFISPITPSVTKDFKIIVPATPVKVRTPLGDDTNALNTPSKLIPSTPIRNGYSFVTPTKINQTIQNFANKTPTKSTITNHVPETPPKTVQKNLKFNKQTPPTLAQKSIKENVTEYSTPKVVKNSFHRPVKKVLHPELSNVDSNKTKVINETACNCMKNSTVCFECLTKPELNVPRAGTPGFRAPEILLRCQNQSTKIDIWSTGVIFASLLSGRYPFFRCMDDMTCLAEIITLIGSSRVKRAANALGKTLLISQKRAPMDLKTVCEKLRNSLRQSTTATENHIEDFRAPNSAYDLLSHLLDPNPFTRFSASEALTHPFFTEPIDLDK